MKFVIFLFAITVAAVTSLPYVQNENIFSELEKDINWKHTLSRRTAKENPSPALEIFGVKISGKITIHIEFADMRAFEKAKAELERINGKNNEGSTETGYTDTIKIKFNEDELSTMVQKELVKSDINMASTIKFEPIEMRDTEIISSKQASKSSITISGKINTKIGFTESVSNGQSSRNGGEIWIKSKGGNRYVDHTTEFNAKKLTGLQIENVAIIPSA